MSLLFSLTLRKTQMPPPLRHSARRLFAVDSKSQKQGRLSLTLYRSLLRWCNETGEDVPLASFVPPVYLAQPTIDDKSLAAIVANSDEIGNNLNARLQYAGKLLPKTSQLEPHQLTVPIRTTKDMEALFRAVFRINTNYATPEVVKQRTTLAFETLRSLNELTEALDSLRQEQNEHLDRTGVTFSIGQVVQHKCDRWRGVIVAWKRVTPAEVGEIGPTSLTTKNYASALPAEEKGKDDKPISDSDVVIRYTLVLDIGDVHLLGGKRKLVQGKSGFPMVAQSDLELIGDESLCRVRSNWIPRYFNRFDTTRKLFEPNDLLAFKYALGGDKKVGEDEFNETLELEEIAKQVVDGVQKIAGRLERCILDQTSSPEYRGMDLLASFYGRVRSLMRGDVVSTQRKMSSPSKDVLSQQHLAALHLRHLLNISLEISEVIWQRRIAKENKSRIRFSLGDIVQHKKYGFRGVVVAWDPKPSVDVTRWDGLGHIENPNELPFYHVIPDQNDCIDVFGGERPFRYVCEENLEVCPINRTLLEVDLDPEWSWSPSESKYIPPNDLKLKYAEDIDDADTTASCMVTMSMEICKLHVAIRDPSDDSASLEHVAIAEQISKANLFALLNAPDCMDDAIVVEETVKEIWKANRDPELRWRLDNGIADLLQGKKERALDTFSQLAVDDPQYAEAWNKKSTCHFMLGEMESSWEAAKQTLELQPDHFQALNGLGLVQYETKRYKLAAESFRRSLRLDPWSPVSSRLSACLDLLEDMSDEQGAAEGSAPYEV